MSPSRPTSGLVDGSKTTESVGGSISNGERGRVDLDGLQLDGVVGVGVDVADVGGVDAHDGRDVAGLGLGALLAAEVVEGEELLDLAHGARSVVLHHENLVAGVDGAGVDAADADAAHILGVVDGHALHGERAVHVHLGSGQVAHDHVEHGEHVLVVVGGVQAGEAVHGGGVDHVLHGELELLVGGAEVGHEVERVVDHGLGAGALAVDLVDHDHDGEAGVDGVAQDEARLGHGALGCVDKQQGAVGHAQDALDLAAKVGVTRGVDDVDLHALVLDRDVLGEDGDAALALLVVGVEHALLDLLVLAEGVGGPEHLVHERGLAVVDVRDDSDVPDVLLTHGSLSPLFSRPTSAGGSVFSPYGTLQQRGHLSGRRGVGPRETITSANAVHERVRGVRAPAALAKLEEQGVGEALSLGLDRALVDDRAATGARDLSHLGACGLQAGLLAIVGELVARYLAGVVLHGEEHTEGVPGGEHVQRVAHERARQLVGLRRDAIAQLVTLGHVPSSCPDFC